MHTLIELRSATRYRLSAPALIMWARQEGETQSGQGVTRDINTFGVYVQTNASPPVGALVQLEIVLPKLMDPGSGMRLHGEGVVLRVDPPGSKPGEGSEGGFAASVQFHTDATESVLSHLTISERVARVV